MTFLQEGFREPGRIKAAINALCRILTRKWVLMEICGGQTHAIMQDGLDQLLPPEIELIHGPGCPVCVTSLELVDKAIYIASQQNAILCSFGDMLRVPGSNNDLFSVRATGGQVKIVYSPLDAIKIAQQNPDKEVVFFAIGFETTAPVNAASVIQAQSLGLKNFSLLVSQVCVPPAMNAILSSSNNRVQAFLAAGHVCSVMGYWEYPPIAKRFKVPIVVTGFEPLDLITGIIKSVSQLEEEKYEVENAYERVVSYEGNQAAQKMINRVFEPVDRVWRGIGMIPMSGLGLNSKYTGYDAEKRFDLKGLQTKESEICIAGQILQGIKTPVQCPAFGTLCTPDNPLGAPMVSSEGACSAYYHYAKR